MNIVSPPFYLAMHASSAAMQQLIWETQTDVDDKIIIRARQQYLLAQFKSKHLKFDNTTLEETHAAWRAYIAKNLDRVPAQTRTTDFKAAAELSYKNVIEDKSLDGTAAPGDLDAKIKMHVGTAQAAADGLEAYSASKSMPQYELYSKVADVLLPYLDDLHGSQIDATDHSK